MGNGAGTFTLKIADDRQAVWMAINDSFTKKYGNDENKASHGMLIQLGVAVCRINSRHVTAIDSIEFKNASGIVHSIPRMDLEYPNTCWIDIQGNASTGSQGKVMDLGDLPRLRIAGNDKRSLHKYFNPYTGGITIWPDGPLNIQMARKEAEKGANHTSSTFTLEGDVSVRIYRNGVEMLPALNPSEINIKEAEWKPGPGQTENPPQYP